MPVAGETDGNSNRTNSVTHILSSNTPLFHLKLYALISILVLRSDPLVSKEILEIKALNRNADCFDEEGRIGNSAPCKSSEGASDDVSGASDVSAADAQNIGWGRWYCMKELGDGDAWIRGGECGLDCKVYNSKSGVGPSREEFNVEVEAIGKVRHKNLVGLVGYCTEGPQRILVYEYVDNGNLEQWLHGDVGPVSPLTWDIRMMIAIGTAKGCGVSSFVPLAYLHEGLEPKVVHRDVKSSNILLDKKWNAKVSDFGLAKLLGSEASYVTTRVMGTFGYVSPEYASTGMLNEGSDVYSFGVLLMEIITGRSPIDYSRAPGEMNLVDWFKGMVASRRGEELVDPLIEIQPSPRALKRALLVCLRCIDLDTNKRPKMGQIVHMLEADDFPFRSEHRPALHGRDTRFHPPCRYPREFHTRKSTPRRLTPRNRDGMIASYSRHYVLPMSELCV
ncbi:putative serine/threonine-protein kinase [Hibiscus syriacus]|uniref:non-specific serine/threonine protein kinase n=1 Tax=Hibiscus syriacus TaxID=106335 RepID=A0A6A2Y8J0_HIBSY|nr:putative serine/threonine-protein kinase [Hibiscus syriacus]